MDVIRLGAACDYWDYKSAGKNSFGKARLYIAPDKPMPKQAVGGQSIHRSLIIGGPRSCRGAPHERKPRQPLIQQHAAI